jgi:hypothetical protein
MGFFSKIIKGALDIATLPVAIVKDAATLGGALTDQHEPYTFKKLKKVQNNFGRAYDKL